jgi:hypothetical protein
MLLQTLRIRAASDTAVDAAANAMLPPLLLPLALCTSQPIPDGQHVGDSTSCRGHRFHPPYAEIEQSDTLRRC